jgi:HSP20 family molecular chaperone IbpA
VYRRCINIPLAIYKRCSDKGLTNLRPKSSAFARNIRLPFQVKADAIEATYGKGVLSLRLPKVEEAKPKRIVIKVTPQPKVIEAKTK